MSKEENRCSSPSLNMLASTTIHNDPMFAATAAIANKKNKDPKKKIDDFLTRLSFVSFVERFLPNFKNKHAASRGKLIESHVKAQKRTLYYLEEKGTHTVRHQLYFRLKAMPGGGFPRA